MVPRTGDECVGQALALGHIQLILNGPISI